MTRALRRLWPWLRALAGVGILVLLGWRLGAEAFVDGLRVINVPSVLAALGIGLLTTVCSASRWWFIARRLDLALPWPVAVADYYRALLLNAVLPAGVLGDVHRGVRHGRLVGDVGKGMRAVVLERVAGQVVVIVAGVAVLLTRPDVLTAVAAQLAPSRWFLLAALAALVVLGAFTLWPRWDRARARARRVVGTVLTEARLGVLARDTWPWVVLLSVAALAGHVLLFVAAARIAGSPAPVTQLVPLVMLALLAMGLPVNVGGWGPREAVAALAFAAAGLGAAQGLTTAVVYGVLTLIASVPGAAVLLIRGRTRPRAREDYAGVTSPARRDDR